MMYMRSLPKSIALAGLASAIGLLPMATFAQSETSPAEKTLKISVTESKGSTTQTSEKEILLKDQSLESLVQELGVLNGWDLSEDGDEIEIVIRKKAQDASKTEEVTVEMALPSMAQEKLDELIAKHKDEWEEGIEKAMNKPLLGVYSSSHDKGARINQVMSNTGASEAGLQVGDIVLTFEGQPVPYHTAFTNMVLAKKPGDEVAIQIERNGVTQEVTATLGKRKLMEADFDFEFEGNQTYQYRFHSNDGLEEEETKADATQQPFLGVLLKGHNDQEVAITKVYANSAAEEMGLKAGDRIVSFNKEEVTSLGELINQIRELNPGDAVELEYEREGNQATANGSLKSKAETLPNGPATTVHTYRKSSSNPNEMVETRKIVLNMKVEDASPEEEEEWLEQNNLASAPKLDIEDVSFSPNPNRGQFRLSFNLLSEGQTVLEIRDVKGSPIRVQVLGNFTGAYQEDFDISEQAAGVYFLTITQNDQRFIKKIVKN